MNTRSVPLAVLALTAIAAAVLAGDTVKPTPHPHFDDGGTLTWFTKAADARAAAKNSGRFLFIEYGREN